MNMILKDLLDLLTYKTDINLFFEHSCSGIVDSDSYIANANADREVAWIEIDKDLLNIGLYGDDK